MAIANPSSFVSVVITRYLLMMSFARGFNTGRGENRTNVEQAATIRRMETVCGFQAHLDLPEAFHVLPALR
jgi:hypothetical protein